MSSNEQFLGHPKGLFLLFIVEMWERFSYYGMRALLVLYLVDKTHGGYGWDEADALVLYGNYTGLVYLTPLIGGWLADNYLGQRKSVIIGGFLMALGHFLMAFTPLWAFYSALILLIVGNGLFKPNISTMVGSLYEQGDSRRDAGFTIFYMGINLGAFLAPLACGALGQNHESFGWHWGFGLAGIGMVLGLVMFMLLAQKYLGDIGKEPEGKTNATDAPKAPLTVEEKHRISVILVLMIFVVIFWAGFEQAGGYMNIYTDKYTDRMIGDFEVYTSWFQSLNPMFILLLGPVLSVFWVRLGKKNPPSPVKMVFGMILLGVGFLFMVGSVMEQGGDTDHKSHMMWIVMAYLFHTVGELCLSPIGLSMVTKLAPLRLASLLMGIWFLSNAFANKLAGVIGGLVANFGPLQIFGGIAGVSIGSGIILFLISGKLVEWMHGAEAISETIGEHQVNEEFHTN